MQSYPSTPRMEVITPPKLTPRMEVMTPPKLTMETFSSTGLSNVLGGMVEGDERVFSRGNTTEVFDSCIPKTTSSNHSLHAKTVDEGIFATPNTKEKLPKNSGNAPRKTANAELALAAET